MSIIREEPPKFPHEFVKIRQAGIMTMHGTTEGENVTYGRCKWCGKPWLGVHDFYSECRERKRRDQMKGI